MDVVETCLQQPFASLTNLFNKAEQIFKQNFGNKLFLYAPGMVNYETSYCKSHPLAFPAISVTEKRCYLNCEHCGGKLLESMFPASSPYQLYSLMKKLIEKGAKGFLISGGSNKEGYVPLKPFLPIVAKIKREFSVEIVVHCGLPPPPLVDALAEAGVDGVLVDIVGSDLTLKQVCHLEQRVEAFRDLLKRLSDHSLPVVPHIVVGIHYGKILGEKAALEIISGFQPAAVVIVALMPLEGTGMMDVMPPSPQDIGRIMLAARLLLPNTPIVLGCARPRGASRVSVDALAVRCGVNGVTYPSDALFTICKRRGIALIFSEKCCGLIWKDIYKQVGEVGLRL